MDEHLQPATTFLKEIVNCRNSAVLMRALAIDMDPVARRKCLAAARAYDHAADLLEGLQRELGAGWSARKAKN